jgi:cobalt-zinc-cadmium efflux system membrane fusion protein
VVEVAQGKDDFVVIDSGLKPGEEVISVGSLVLAQIYEELKTGQTGAPTASHGVDSN